MTKWTLTLPAPTPSLNTWLTAHWAKRKQIKDDWTMLVCAERNRLKIPKAKEPRTVTITRYGARELDLDNLYGGAKGVLDAIKLAGLVLDDNPEDCCLVVRQVAGVRREHRRTEVEIKFEKGG